MPSYPYYNPYQYQPYQPPAADQLAQLRQPYQQPMQPMQQPAPQAQAQHGNGITWVQGEEGAKAYMVAPGQSVLLMDSENSAFYIKSTDASGMPMPLRIFDYTERTASKSPAVPSVTPGVEYVTRAEFDALAARLDALTSNEPAAAKRKATAKEADADA